MKKFIPKSLSLILCVALVLSTMVSVFGGIFVSAAETDDIESLKAAWTSMISKSAVSTNKWPRFYVNSTGAADTAFMDPSNYDGTMYGISASDLGTFVATQDIGADGSFLFGGQNPTNANADTMTEIHNYADAFVYYKVNSVKTEGQFGLQYTAYSYLGGGTSSLASRTRNSTSKISITQEDVAKGWQRIALGEFLNNDEHFSYDWRTETGFTSAERLHRLILNSENGLEANITFGSLVGYNSASLPADSDSWGIKEWLAAASELDLSDYFNTEAFETLVAELSVQYDVYADDIKAAWGNMIDKTAVSTNKWPRFYVNSTTTADTAYMAPADYVAAGGVIDGIKTSDLGTFVATQDIGADGSFLFSGQNPSNFAADTITYIHDYEDAYIYYKVNSVTTEGQFGLKYYVNSTLGGYVSQASRERTSTSKISITQEDVAKGWQRIALGEFLNNDNNFSYDWRTETGFTSSEYLFRLALNSENGLEANITFGSLVGIKKATAPDVTTSEELYNAAMALNPNDYEGYEGLQAVLEAYKPYEYTTDMLTLKAAWEEMTDSAVTPEATATATFNGGNSYAVAANEDLANFSNVYVYYKVNSVATEGTLIPAAVGSDMGPALNDANKIYITKDDIGTWQKLSIADFVTSVGTVETIYNSYDVENWRSAFTGENALESLSFYAADGLNAEISFSGVYADDITATDGITYTSEITDWLVAADNFDTSAYSNTAKFEATLKELKVKYADESGIALLENAWGKLTNGGNAVALPSGYESWSLADWVANTADAVDAYDNNELYLENVGIYKLLNADEYYINKIQSAWSGLRTYVRNIYYPYSADAGTLTTADTPAAQFETMGSTTGNFVKEAGAAANVSYADRQNVTSMNYDQFRSFDNTIEDDMVIRIKIDNSGENSFTAGTVTAVFTINYLAGGGSKLTYNITEADYNRGYIDISLDEIMTNGLNGGITGGWEGLVAYYANQSKTLVSNWREAITTGNTGSLETLRIRAITLQFDANIAATMELSSVVSTKAVAMPTEDTTDWTLQKWALEAQKVLEGNIQNPDALQAVLAEIKENSLEIEKVLALRETARATTKATVNRGINNNGIEITYKNCANDDERAHFTRGFYYNIPLAASSQIYFSDVNPPATADQDAYIVYRINSVTTEGQIQIDLQTSAPFSNSTSALKLPVTQSEVGQWRVVKLSDIVTSSGYYDAWYRQRLNQGYTRFGDHWEDYVNNGPISKLYFTSVGAEFTIDIIEILYDSYLNIDVTDDGSTASILEAAAALDATGYKNADAFNETVAALTADKASGDANNDGRVNVADLLRVKRGMADPTVEVYMFAADMDADAVLTANDLAAIQAKLLA